MQVTDKLGLKQPFSACIAVWFKMLQCLWDLLCSIFIKSSTKLCQSGCVFGILYGKMDLDRERSWVFSKPWSLGLEQIFAKSGHVFGKVFGILYSKMDLGRERPRVFPKPWSFGSFKTTDLWKDLKDPKDVCAVLLMCALAGKASLSASDCSCARSYRMCMFITCSNVITYGHTVCRVL